MGSGAGAELGVRAASAAVLIPVAIVPAWTGGWPLAVLLGVSGWCIGHEWLRMIGRPGAQAAALSMGAAGAGMAAYAGAGPIAGGAGAVLGVVAGGRVWRGPGELVHKEWLGILGLAVPLVLVWELRGTGDEGRRLLLWCLLVVGSADTFAYLCGRTLRGRRLAPTISPGKTWSGAVGGLAAAAAVGGCTGTVFGWSAVFAVAAALVVGLAAAAGDLAVSAVKRAHGRKDTGRLIPGHGGVLDRIDGLLFGVTAVAAWKLAGGGI